MSETVFILGAGASAESGAPLMNNFIDKAEELLLYNPTSIDQKAFEAVFDMIGVLQNLYAKSYIDLDNIESLFGAVEMGLTIGKLGTIYEVETIRELRSSLINVIVQTLECTISFPAKEDRLPIPDTDGQGNELTFLRVMPTESYRNFATLLKEHFPKSSIITFNYDMALDVALRNVFGNEPNYSLYDDDGSTNLQPKLMKLHGSINWYGCTCGRITPFSLEESTRRGNITSDGVANIILPRSSIESPVCRCGERCNGRVIVPPTWNKNAYQGELSKVWKTASNELSSARNIFVIGYSLPETDSFFRYLYALSTAGRSRIQRFWVYNYGGLPEVLDRYKRLLGSSVRDRRFQYINHHSFSAAIGMIKYEFEK